MFNYPFSKKYTWLKANHSVKKATRLQRKRRLVDELGGKCVDCGFGAHLAALDFDHVDPETKSFTIANKLSVLNYSDLLIEAQKCVLRCANCHRIKTHPDATD